MAEVVAGIASVAQIVDLLAKTACRIVDFCREVSDAPRVFQRVQDNLVLLQQLLKDVQSCADELENESILPPAARQMLRSAAEQTQQTLTSAQATFRKAGTTSGSGDPVMSPGTRRRIIMVLRDKPMLKRVLAELEEFDRLLLLVIQLANMRIALAHYQGFMAAKTGTETKNDTPDAAKTPLHVTRPHQATSYPFRCSVLGVGSMLRRLGFYVEITTRSSSQHFFAASVYLGYKLPGWLWARSFDVEFGVVVPRLIRSQYRVPLDSPFLEACRNGDVWQIRQYLCDGVGSVGDRAMCNGMTPLLVSLFQNFKRGTKDGSHC
jgi:hypothetical protein